MKREESIEFAKERRAGVQRAMDLLSHEWKELEDFLGDSSERKNSMKIEIASKVLELRAKEKELALKEKEAEARELERQKILAEKQKELDERALKLESKERVLAKEENEMHSRFQGIRKRQSELRLGKKRLADLRQILDAEVMMFDLAMLKSVQQPDSAAKNKGVEQKKRRNVAEIGESSTRPQSSDSVRDAHQTMDQGQDGLSFLLTIRPCYKDQGALSVPSSFVSTFDWSGKKHVILLTDEGSFRLDVKRYSYKPGKVFFTNGWRAFYRKNRLCTGLECVFRVKEHVVNGDVTVFSMDVSVAGP